MKKSIYNFLITKFILSQYYDSATHSRPIRSIFLGIFATAFISLFPTLLVYQIYNGTYQGSLPKGYFLIGFMSIFGFYLITVVIVRILGYLHRDKINLTDIPQDLPKKEFRKVEMWWMIALIGVYQAASLMLDYFDIK